MHRLLVIPSGFSRAYQFQISTGTLFLAPSINVNGSNLPFLRDGCLLLDIVLEINFKILFSYSYIEGPIFSSVFKVNGHVLAAGFRKP